MDFLCEDRFLVFLRSDVTRREEPETNEEPVASCDSYEEARRVRNDAPHQCVIRYSGCTGGGD